MRLRSRYRVVIPGGREAEELKGLVFVCNASLTLPSFFSPLFFSPSERVGYAEE